MSFITRLFVNREKQLNKHIQALVHLAQGGASVSSSLREKKEQCIEIGQKINRRWGFDGMSYVCDAIRNRLGYAAYREVASAWDGIGDWKA